MADASAEVMVQEERQPAGPPGVLRDRFIIHSGRPLANLSTPNAEAFTAEDKRDPSRKLYALICRPELPPRVNVMRALKGVSNAGLQQLVEWGPIVWPPLGRQCMSVVYERPAGGRVASGLKSEIRRIDEYDITRKLIEPAVAAIKELTARGITHRAIRPTNLFFMDDAGERLAFGDCVTAPAAFDQAMIFETIESGMAMPVGRGGGTFADDLYSLGVTILFLLLGRNPLAHLDDEAILRAKIQLGSYGALVGEARLPLPMIEVLRGLLSDDASQRWDIESLDLWRQGRRLSPLQTRGEKRAARGFPFQGKEFFNCRELAAAMAKNWELAIPPVLEGKLELWLRRAVEDKERAQTVSDVVRGALVATSDKRAAIDLMLCKILTILDNSAPIRYKGLHAMPDGFGSALAALVAQRGDTRLIIEAILREVPKLWFEAQGDVAAVSFTDTNFKELRGYLSQTGMGFGVERCLYEMNDALPCQSTLLEEEYVVELKELLPALNKIASKRSDFKQWPCDRHIAAFMGARARSDIDRSLVQLSNADAGKALMAMINLFAVYQYRLGPESLPALAGWVGALCEPVVNVYHSRERRKEISKELPRLVRRGSLVEIYSLLDDAQARQKDQAEFAWAQAQYQAAEEEMRRINSDEEEREREVDRIGKQTAAVAGILIGMVTTSIVVIMTVW